MVALMLDDSDAVVLGCTIRFRKSDLLKQLDLFPGDCPVDVSQRRALKNEIGMCDRLLSELEAQLRIRFGAYGEDDIDATEDQR